MSQTIDEEVIIQKKKKKDSLYKMHVESTKTFEKNKKSNHMIVIDIKSSLYMKNKDCCSKCKIIINCGQTPTNNSLKCF